MVFFIMSSVTYHKEVRTYRKIVLNGLPEAAIDTVELGFNPFTGGTKI